jgi:hypothetical protein
MSQSPLFEAALEVQNCFIEKGWRFCLIGGLALPRWGEARPTADVDVCVLRELGAEEALWETLLGRFGSRMTEPFLVEFARGNRMMLLSTSNGVALDVVYWGIPAFEEAMMDRASDFEVAPGLSLKTCSAEDFVALKAFADRPSDWIDAQSVLARQAGKLDQAYTLQQLSLLCETRKDFAPLKKLESLLRPA